MSRGWNRYREKQKMSWKWGRLFGIFWNKDWLQKLVHKCVFASIFFLLKTAYKCLKRQLLCKILHSVWTFTRSLIDHVWAKLKALGCLFFSELGCTSDTLVYHFKRSSLGPPIDANKACSSLHSSLTNKWMQLRAEIKVVTLHAF